MYRPLQRHAAALLGETLQEDLDVSKLYFAAPLRRVAYN